MTTINRLDGNHDRCTPFFSFVAPQTIYWGYVSRVTTTAIATHTHNDYNEIVQKLLLSEKFNVIITLIYACAQVVKEFKSKNYGV